MHDDDATADRAATGLSESGFIRRTVIGLGIAVLFAIGFLLVAFAADAVILSFAAVWFAACLFHGAELLARWTGLSSRWAMGIVLTLVVSAAVGFVALLGVQFAMQMNELVRNLGDAVEGLQEQLKEFPQLQQMVRRPGTANRAVQAVSGQAGSSIATLLTTPFGFLVNVLFIFFTGAYLATSPSMYLNGFVALFPVNQRTRLKRICREVGESLWHWTLARLASMVIVGTCAGLGLALLGIPMAITLGVTTAVFVFVPNIGPILATIPPLLLSFSLGGWMPLYVLMLYAGIEMIESWIITPIIHEKEDALPAALILVAQLLFGILFGLIGVTFAMPIALAAMIFVQRLYVERGLENGAGQTAGKAP